MSCTPIRFGISNQIPLSTLTASPAPIVPTQLNWIKDQWSARRAVWPSPDEIVIEGTVEEAQFAEYFALVGADELGHAQVQMELFNGDTLVDSLAMGFVEVVNPIPLGEWRAGIDPYGLPRDIDRPDVFIHWFNRPVAYTHFRLTIKASDYSEVDLSDVRLRMLAMGQALELQKQFSYGVNIRFLTDPELVLTSSGSHIPVRGQTNSRALTISLEHMTDRDRSALWAMESTLRGQPFIVSAFPSATGWEFSNYSLLGRFGQALDFTHAGPGRHQASNITILEA